MAVYNRDELHQAYQQASAKYYEAQKLVEELRLKKDEMFREGGILGTRIGEGERGSIFTPDARSRQFEKTIEMLREAQLVSWVARQWLTKVMDDIQMYSLLGIKEG